jgi:hypothetical protein
MHPSAQATAIDLRLLVDRIPMDVLHEHVLPRCSIDIRLALKVPPRRLWHGTTRQEYEQRVSARLRVVHQRRQACYNDYTDLDSISLRLPMVIDGVCSPIYHQEEGTISWVDEIEMVFNFMPCSPNTPTSCEALRVCNETDHLNGDCLAYWEPVYLDGWVTRAPGMFCSKHPEDITEMWCRIMDPMYTAPRRICTCT